MIGFLGIQSLVVPRSVIQEGHHFLRIAGRAGREGLVLWIGRRDGATFIVTELVIPEQQGIRTNDGVCVIIEGKALARLNADLYRRQLQLIAQIHSHPGAAYHSSTDDEYAIATKVGCLSLVVPDFASHPFSLAECAVFRLSTAGQWVRLSTIETCQLICVAGDGVSDGAC